VDERPRVGTWRCFGGKDTRNREIIQLIGLASAHWADCDNPRDLFSAADLYDGGRIKLIVSSRKTEVLRRTSESIPKPFFRVEGEFSGKNSYLQILGGKSREIPIVEGKMYSSEKLHWYGYCVGTRIRKGKTQDWEQERKFAPPPALFPRHRPGRKCHPKHYVNQT